MNVNKLVLNYKNGSIDQDNRILFGQLESMCDSVNGKARVRRLDAMMILEHISKFESCLSITKTALNGTTIDVDPFAEKFPSAYKGIPMSTTFMADFKNGQWYVRGVFRERCHTVECKANLSDSAINALIEKYSRIEVL